MKPVATQPIEICILAGGLSSRMGRDKSRVRLGQRTLLAHIRTVARQLDLPIRVIRRDAVPRCGPIGGIYTALTRSGADALLFLACDMPFISPTFLKQLLKSFRNQTEWKRRSGANRTPATSPSPGGPRCAKRTSLMGKVISGGLGKPLGWGEGERKSNFSPALFSLENNLAGFPCVLHREISHPIVSRQIAQSRFSLQSLARALKAKTLRPPRRAARQLLNINTPADLQSARHQARALPIPRKKK